VKTLRLQPRLRVSPKEAIDRLVAFGIGPDDSVHAVHALDEPETRVLGPGGARFFRTRPATPQAYRIRSWLAQDDATDIVVQREEFNVTAVQPLGEDLLLVCPRCSRFSDDDIEQNALVYGRDGVLKRAFVLGDGIRHVAVASDRTIWVGYFDEGIFGNFGWDSPLGASGLVQWSPEGAMLYEFTTLPDLDPMADCYALNVDPSGAVWCCYYDSFPLVRIESGAITGVWTSEVAGARCIAVSEPYALLHGCDNARDVLVLLELLPSGTTRRAASLRVCDLEGKPLDPCRAIARGDTIYFVADGDLYTVDVMTCLNTV
jgi:hypothetical protein